MTSKLRKKLWVSVGIAAISTWAVPALAQTAVADGADSVSSADIIVTASKREERQRDVPAAITAIPADVINKVGIQDFRDYASLVPGLSQRHNGNPGQGTIILRGLNTSSQQGTNTTAFYLDESPFSSSGFLSVSGLLTPSPDLGDVERIEVLKGPQGTLYGATSLGGLVKVVSKVPDANQSSGSVRAELTGTDGGDLGFSTRASVNLPLIADKLAIRASGGYRRIGGFIDNVGTGRANANDAEIYGGRLAIRATPTDDLTLDLVGFIQTIKSSGSSYQDNRAGTLIPIARKYTQNNFADLDSTIDYRLISGSAAYDFGPITWLTTASYSEIRTDLNSDFTKVYVPLVAASVPVGTAAPGSFSPNNNKFSLESRLTSQRLGAFEFIAGIFYTKETSSYPIIVSLVNPTTGARLASPFDTLLRTGTLSDYSEFAGFGNLIFYLTDTFDVTGGIRVSQNNDTSTTGAPINGLPASVFFRPRVTSAFKASDTATTYLGTIRWRPTPQISTFLRAASGYRPGGPQTNPAPPPGAQTTIKADTLWNYEAGIKGSFLDGSLLVDASVYRIDWSDIQLPTLFSGITLQTNSGKARVNGFEASITARPADSFTLSTAIGYTDAKLIEVPAGITSSIGAGAGDRLPLSSKWTVAALADFQTPLSEGAKFTTGATLRYQSDMPNGYAGDRLNTGITLPGFATLDLRAGVDFARFTLQVRAENLFNKLAYTSANTNRIFAGQVLPTQVAVIRPRSFVVSVSAKF